MQKSWIEMWLTPVSISSLVRAEEWFRHDNRGKYIYSLFSVSLSLKYTGLVLWNRDTCCTLIFRKSTEKNKGGSITGDCPKIVYVTILHQSMKAGNLNNPH